jgi:hypothetical protein
MQRGTLVDTHCTESSLEGCGRPSRVLDERQKAEEKGDNHTSDPGIRCSVGRAHPRSIPTRNSLFWPVVAMRKKVDIRGSLCPFGAEPAITPKTFELAGIAEEVFWD